MRRRRYEGPVYFDGEKGFHFALGRRRRRLVVVDGEFYFARRSDPSHQARYHRRYAPITPS